MSNIYEHGLDKNAANFSPITPISFIERAAKIYPNKVAVVHGGLRRTWSETYARTRQLASALIKAGVGVGDKRWSKKYKSEILNSRLLGTTAIANAVAELKPQVFISASAIGWYGESGNRAVVETDRAGDDFLAAVCREWEAAADLAGDVRTVKIRTGLVLDPTGGALGRMLPLFRLGLGGKLGNGKQWWSWITLHDQIRAIVFALENPISGPVNLTAPNPVTNQEFTAALARAMHRPALFPAPAIALKIALGGFSSEILGSKRVIPHVLQDAGFTWDYPHISEALSALIED